MTPKFIKNYVSVDPADEKKTKIFEPFTKIISFATESNSLVNIDANIVKTHIGALQ
jgi:hypothetical protein